MQIAKNTSDTLLEEKLLGIKVMEDDIPKEEEDRKLQKINVLKRLSEHFLEKAPDMKWGIEKGMFKKNAAREKLDFFKKHYNKDG